MEPKTKKLIHYILIVGLILIVVLAIILAIVLSSKNNDEDKNKESGEEEVDIVNSYNNTEELIAKFPVGNPTTVLPGLEKNIQNRLLTGFENWNRGFKAWKAWGNILYTNDSIYNVHGARLTLKHYQDAMDVSLKQATILMGAFHNMLINEDFTAIHYDFITVVGDYQKKGKVMEFVKFKDYGDPLGTRVVEGWGSTKDSSYEGMAHFQGDEEKKVQQEQLDYILKYELPETDDLKLKYIIKNPTKYIDENAEDILNIILTGFDKWNEGIQQYLEWVDTAYDEKATSSSLDERNRTLAEYKKEMEELTKTHTIKKLFFDNVLIRDNWAALHYRYTNYNSEDKSTYAGDRMQFLKFEQKSDNLKIVASWIQ
jgi:hypothetical protein